MSLFYDPLIGRLSLKSNCPWGSSQVDLPQWHDIPPIKQDDIQGELRAMYDAGRPKWFSKWYLLTLIFVTGVFVWRFKLCMRCKPGKPQVKTETVVKYVSGEDEVVMKPPKRDTATQIKIDGQTCN